MHAKMSCLGASLLLPFFLIPASAADADPVAGSHIASATKPVAGGFQIVNLTQNTIVRTRFGSAAAVDLATPIGPGATASLEPIVTGSGCGTIEVDVTFDDDTVSVGSVDLCAVRKLTLHGDVAPQ